MGMRLRCAGIGLLLTLALAVFLLSASPQGAMSSLPYRVPVYCSGTANACAYPYVPPNSTGVIICRQCESGAPTDSLDDVWNQDQCSPYDNGDCAYSTRFNVPWLTGVKVIFPPGEGNEVFMLIYSGVWTLDQGSYGTYNAQNSAFSDCINGQNCPYNWTLPVEVEPGEMLISWDNSNATGQGIAVAGFGFTVEGNSGHFAIEDMVAPVASVYIGSMSWNNPDGSPGGGSHWTMGIAAYQQVNSAGGVSEALSHRSRVPIIRH